jgi:hypothetical protein
MQSVPGGWLGSSSCISSYRGTSSSCDGGGKSVSGLQRAVYYEY